VRHARGIRAACCVLAAGVAGPVGAQQLGGGQAADVSVVRVIAVFVLCVMLALAGAYALRFRMTGRLDLPTLAQGAARKLVLVERLRLGPQHELCLVALEGREFMVSVSPAGIARFEAFDDAAGSARS